MAEVAAQVDHGHVRVAPRQLVDQPGVASRLPSSTNTISYSPPLTQRRGQPPVQLGNVLLLIIERNNNTDHDMGHSRSDL